MYGLFEPAYPEKTTFAKFVQESAVRSRFDVTSHEIVKIEPREEARVIVFMEIDTAFPQFGGPHKITVQDPWVRLDGTWYTVHEPYKLPLPDKPPN